MAKEKHSRYRNEHIVDHLRSYIKELSQLVESLSDDGVPLDSDQKQMIRTALSGSFLKLMNDEARMFFIGGHFKDFESNMLYVLSTLEELV